MESLETIMAKQIAEIEQKDEEQVLAELAGETIAEMVYMVETWDRKLKQKVKKGKLSWAGTKEVARSRGNIMLSEPVITDLDGFIRIVVRATDLTRNFTVFGGCQQPKKMRVNDYNKETGEETGHHYEDDLYCFQKGLSKAQRNALTVCIPADYTANFIARFLGAAKLPGVASAKALPRGKPVKSQVKPLADWENITKEMVSDYQRLERVIWDLCKVQPPDMYRELGVSSRADMTITPWESFLTLKRRYAGGQGSEPIDGDINVF